MYDEIKKLIERLANDMSRTSKEILEDLQGLRDEIEMLIEATEADIEAQEPLDD